MEEYVVVKTHNFDPETEAAQFTDYCEATAYLHWLWESYYNEEIENDSDLDEQWCYHESDYAKIQWKDGDYTEFNLIEVLPKRKEFPEDWEKYITE